MSFQYIHYKHIDFNILKSRRFLAKYLVRYIVYLIPVVANRLIFPILFKTCMRSGKIFSLNPYLVKYFYKDKLLIFVSPQEIKKFMRDWIIDESGKKYHTNDYFLASGDWANITDDLENMYVFKEAYELEKQKWEYKKTDVYTNLIKRAKTNPAIKQHILLNSIEKVDAYFERFKNLYNSIAKKGIIAIKDFSLTAMGNQDSNIGIAIDIDGSLIKLPGGQHRVSIALIQRLSVIPVEVRMIHKSYLQKICDEYNLSCIDGVTKILNDLKQ